MPPVFYISTKKDIKILTKTYVEDNSIIIEGTHLVVTVTAQYISIKLYARNLARIVILSLVTL